MSQDDFVAPALHSAKGYWEWFNTRKVYMVHIANLIINKIVCTIILFELKINIISFQLKALQFNIGYPSYMMNDTAIDNIYDSVSQFNLFQNGSKNTVGCLIYMM